MISLSKQRIGAIMSVCFGYYQPITPETDPSVIINQNIPGSPSCGGVITPETYPSQIPPGKMTSTRHKKEKKHHRQHYDDKQMPPPTPVHPKIIPALTYPEASVPATPSARQPANNNIHPSTATAKPRSKI